MYCVSICYKAFKVCETFILKGLPRCLTRLAAFGTQGWGDLERISESWDIVSSFWILFKVEAIRNAYHVFHL